MQDSKQIGLLTDAVKKSRMANILKGHMTMAVYVMLNEMNTVMQRVEFVQISPGLHCRTQITA